MSDQKDDTAAIGRTIYNEKILPTLGPEHKGKVVIIDVKSGDYEIADKSLTATLRLLERRPDAFTWAERVGFPAPHRLGFRSTYGILPISEIKKRREKRHDRG